jgi:D-3-phosphoglycerate dehydrogenase
MKIVLTDHGFPSIEQERALFAAAGHELVVAQCKTPAELIPFCRDADALLVQWATISRELIATLDRCKVIVRYGIGVDSVDLAAAGARRIPVCNVPDYCIDEVADHALALALALARQVPQTDAAVRAGTWKIMPPAPFAAFRDLTFATAGFGRIARAVLARAQVFGFKLAAYDPFVDDATFAAAGVRKLAAAELLREAGILSLHLPLTDETKHFLNRTSLATMRRDAVIVNTARGGAGLDVYETEPLPSDHPLRLAPNTLLTSHTAWYSAGSVPELQRKSAEAVLAGLRGGPLAHVVNQRFFPTP